MGTTRIDLPDDPKAALDALRALSADAPCIVFKKSPTCGVSTSVEQDFRNWLRDEPPVQVAFVDVLERRALARGLTGELGIPHESPQALVFRAGEFSTHSSHFDLTAEWFEAATRPGK